LRANTRKFNPAVLTGLFAVLRKRRRPQRAPELPAAAATFAEIGYDFVAQAPPIATFWARGDLPPPSFRLPLHRAAFQFARNGLSDTLLI